MHQLLPSADDVCSALSAVSQQMEVGLCRPAPCGWWLVEAGMLLMPWACAWEACAMEELKQHATWLHIECLLAAAASMVRIAAALDEWQQECR